MKYFAAIQSVLDASKLEAHKFAHLEYLQRMVTEHRIYLRGKFPDGSGGLTVYQAESIEEARELAEGDPYVSGGVRTLALHEWDMKPRPE